MSSSRSVAPLHLEPRPSPRLRRVLIGAHLATLLPALLSALPPLAVAVLVAAILLSLRASLRAIAPTVRSLRLGRDGRWRDGDDRELQLLPGSYLSNPLVILRLRTLSGGARHTLVLLKDSLDADAFRRLRVRLRLGHGVDEPADAAS